MKKQDILLKLIAVCGEMPVDMRAMAVGSISYATSLVTRLKKEGYITVRKKDGLKGYVLKVKGRQYLLEKYWNDVEYFLMGNIKTNHVRSDLDKRVRLQRMGMVWVFFYYLDIQIFRELKPAIFTNDNEKVILVGNGRKSIYYGSLEFQAGLDKIRGSRACGILLSEETNYVVYNTMEQHMKWAKKTERSMRSWLEGKMMCWGMRSEVEAIILGNNMEFLPELLESDGGIHKNLFRVDDVYEKYYYVPICSEAIIQMNLLKSKKIKYALHHFLSEMLQTVEEREYILASGYDKYGDTVYFCYESELRYLARVKQELGWRQSGKIICMDYQKCAFQKYFGETVKIQVLITEKVLDYMKSLDRNE